MIRDYSMVRIACLDDAFAGIFELKISPVEGQSLHQKDKKRRKWKGKKNYKTKKPKNLAHFLVQKLPVP